MTIAGSHSVITSPADGALFPKSCHVVFANSISGSCDLILMAVLLCGLDYFILSHGALVNIIIKPSTHLRMCRVAIFTWLQKTTVLLWQPQRKLA